MTTPRIVVGICVGLAVAGSAAGQPKVRPASASVPAIKPDPFPWLPDVPQSVPRRRRRRRQIAHPLGQVRRRPVHRQPEGLHLAARPPGPGRRRLAEGRRPECRHRRTERRPVPVEGRERQQPDLADRRRLRRRPRLVRHRPGEGLRPVSDGPGEGRCRTPPPVQTREGRHRDLLPHDPTLLPDRLEGCCDRSPPHRPRRPPHGRGRRRTTPLLLLRPRPAPQ